MRVHFIAIGGAAMHNLAIALKRKGFHVTGSDDKIFDPSRSRLEKEDLLPEEMGWNAERITSDLDAIILGMHAREDNPELIRAQELNIQIFSYPEYIFEQTKNKTRVVIGGSHGKTTITSMILHVLNFLNVDHDYMVGAQLEGFDCMVKLSETAKIAVLEGDEYLSSPIDLRPKFHLYRPHIALLSGIAWDHINVFPTFENYVEQFSIFADLIEKDGQLIYYEDDEHLRKIASSVRSDIQKIPYSTPSFRIQNGITYLSHPEGETALEIFGKHNLQNLNGAMNVCRGLGIADKDFHEAMSQFKGAANRMELMAKGVNAVAYRDFAHSPSKLKATVSALKDQFPERKLLACMELHTFSSLNKTFLEEYKGSMKSADQAIVFYSPETVAHKRLPSISPEEVKAAFKKDDLLVLTDSNELEHLLHAQNWTDQNLLLMSSGNFHGMDLSPITNRIEAS